MLSTVRLCELVNAKFLYTMSSCLVELRMSHSTYPNMINRREGKRMRLWEGGVCGGGSDWQPNRPTQFQGFKCSRPDFLNLELCSMLNMQCFISFILCSTELYIFYSMLNRIVSLLFYAQQNCISFILCSTVLYLFYSMLNSVLSLFPTLLDLF